MASERDIKRRIKSCRNVQQITKAMKMVAAARIKKAENRLKASKPYALKLQEVVTELCSQLEGALHPLMEARPVEKVGVVIVTSDKGLCGAYNNNLLKLAFNYLETTLRSKTVKLMAVGSKGVKFLTRRRRAIAVERVKWNPEYPLAQELAQELSHWYTSGEVDQVLCFYTQSISAMNQKPVLETLLPLKAEKKEGEQSPLPYDFEPSAEQSLGILLPRYLQTLMFRVLMESRVAELGSRLKSMTNATDNADKLAGELTLLFYRIRQDNITKEILEISGGAEALKAR
ncbi:MAG: ATP synthase gamma chain [Candidatus Xenobia bacterium]|jgi:F-type H+-transporting ATPase subunit gamma